MQCWTKCRMSLCSWKIFSVRETGKAHTQTADTQPLPSRDQKLLWDTVVVEEAMLWQNPYPPCVPQLEGVSPKSQFLTSFLFSPSFPFLSPSRDRMCYNLLETSTIFLQPDCPLGERVRGWLPLEMWERKNYHTICKTFFLKKKRY